MTQIRVNFNPSGCENKAVMLEELIVSSYSGEGFISVSSLFSTINLILLTACPMNRISELTSIYVFATETKATVKSFPAIFLVFEREQSEILS